jgi:hypothetical protein
MHVRSGIGCKYWKEGAVIFAGANAVTAELPSRLNPLEELTHAVGARIIEAMLYGSPQTKWPEDSLSVPIQRILGNCSGSTVRSPSPARRTRSSQEWAS